MSGISISAFLEKAPAVQVASFKSGTKVRTVLLIRSLETKVSSKGQNYYRFVFSDQTGLH